MKRQTELFSVLTLSALASLLIMGGAVSPAFAAPPESSEAPKIVVDNTLKTSAATTLLDAAQDASGDVWGIVPSPQVWNMASYWSVARWDGSHWKMRGISSISRGGPLKIAAAPDGAVIAIWNSGEVYEFRSGPGRLLAKIPCDPDGDNSIRLYADKADIWVISKTGDIFHINRKAAPANAAQQVYKSNPANFFPGYQRTADNGVRPIYTPLALTKDSLGRFWFWAQGSSAADNFATLRGFLLWDGVKMRYIPEIQGIPERNKYNSDTRYDAIAQRDTDHFWIGVHNAGMFSMNIHTLAALPVPEPEKGAFDVVQKMLPLGADWAVITGLSYANTTPDNPSGLSGDLWMLRDGVWKKALSGLDKANTPPVAERPLLVTPEGLWIGAYGNGLWLLPEDGTAPRQFDWRSNYSMPDTERLFITPTPVGGLLAVKLLRNSNPGGMTLNVERYAPLVAVKALMTLHTPRRLMQDSKGALWNVAAKPGAKSTAGTLDKWDGAAWSSIPLPPEANVNSLSEVALDNRNNIWLVMYATVPGQAEYHVFSYSINNKAWAKYPTWEKMLEAQAAQLAQEKPNKPDAPDTRWILNIHTPDFSKGKACYSENSTIHYFDGAAWHTYRRSDINPGDTGFAFDGAPFFDKNGSLAININKWTDKQNPTQFVTWRMTGEQAWLSGAYQQGPYEYFANTASLLTPPVGSVTPDFGSCVKDRNGVFWLTAKGMLYRAVPGRCEPQFAPDAPNPFRDGRGLHEVFIDPCGNAVIHTRLLSQSSALGEYVFVPVRP